MLGRGRGQGERFGLPVRNQQLLVFFWNLLVLSACRLLVGFHCPTMCSVSIIRLVFEKGMDGWWIDGCLCSVYICLPSTPWPGFIKVDEKLSTRDPEYSNPDSWPLDDGSASTFRNSSSTLLFLSSHGHESLPQKCCALPSLLVRSTINNPPLSSVLTGDNPIQNSPKS